MAGRARSGDINSACSRHTRFVSIARGCRRSYFIRFCELTGSQWFFSNLHRGRHCREYSATRIQ